MLHFQTKPTKYKANKNSKREQKNYVINVIRHVLFDALSISIRKKTRGSFSFPLKVRRWLS